jgi:hypothetical protein
MGNGSIRDICFSFDDGAGNGIVRAASGLKKGYKKGC